MTALHSFPLQRRRDHSGVALVLVLSFVVLLTVVVLVFLSRMMTARQLSSGSLKQASADQLAVSALDVVTGNLKQEIASTTNSSVATNGTYIVYRPLGNTNVAPIRFGNPPFTAPSPDPAPNLVRISSRSDANQNFPSSLASAVNSTTDASLNGRAVSLARWNSHYLLPLNNTAAATASTNSAPVSSFAAPDWVMVTDTGGPSVLTSPVSNVIGRYAYAIYDEGGLLDVNVAGYPSKSTASQYGDKPALAYADLTQLALPASTGTPLLASTDVDNLVGWRNYASVQPTGTFGSFTIAAAQAPSFFTMVTNNVTGFLTVNPATYNNLTDQAVLSRQQLLKYRVSSGFNANALQYLGTFSRDLNAPSWSPYTPTGSTVDYAGQKNVSTSANRDVLGVRVVTSFTRADGTTAQVGEPLLKYRFPLNRLAGITYKGIVTTDLNQGIDLTDKTTLINGVLSPATAATIQRDFGLVYDAGNASANYPHWDYCGPTGTTVQSSIATLAQVANSTPGREPNFFELLKAAILSGSLGRDAGQFGVWQTSWEEGPASDVKSSDQNVDFQVIQLGANIIDQSHYDSYPTEIHFADPNNGNADTAFYGIENLPYLQRVFAKTLYPDPTNSTAVGVGGWYMAELWNPHQNFGYTMATMPTQFQFCGQGLSEMWAPSLLNTGPLFNLANSGAIQFTVNPSTSPSLCREPTYLSNDNGATGNDNQFLNPTAVVNGTNGNNAPWGGANVIAGLYTGTIAPLPGPGWGGIAPQGCSLLLQYLAPSGSYRTYQVMRNLWGKQQDAANNGAYYYGHDDPRTDRFGTSLGEWIYSGSHRPPGNSIRPDNGQGSPNWNFCDFFPRPSAGFNYPNNSDSQIYNNFYMGTLSDNNNGANTTSIISNPYYADQDGIVRPAEGCYATGDGNYDARPLVPAYASNGQAVSQVGNRPIILNRPFRNVGELGYAFRDMPWKNIDFFTPNSGDAGLLDFFCINESTTTTPMVAGTVSLNTRQVPVLQAIIANAIKDEAGSASPTAPPIPSTEAASIANAIVGWTQSSSSGQGPFQYRGDLLTKASSTLVASGASASDQQIKIRREAALRALSDVGTTRTWTLLIDLVAQVGHYPPGATSLKQFVVDGEKRYWLHIAIDRYTGQIVDRVLEPVYE